MKVSMNSLSLTSISTIFLILSILLPITLAGTPPYIKAGLKFVYQIYDGKTQQPENVFHNYIIEFATTQRILIRIESDVVKSQSIEADGDGNILGGGGRIDLWIPIDLQVGSKIKLMEYDAIVAMKNYDLDKSGRLTFTVISSTDQKIMWLYVDGGSIPEANQLLGLLFGVVFTSANKFMVFTKVEQAEVKTVVTTKTTQTITSKTLTTPLKTTVTARSTVTVGGETTLTTYITTTVIQTTVTQVSTITTHSLETHATTITTVSTVTPDTQITEAGSSFIIPLPVAVVVALVIVGGGFFYVRSWKKPLPPKYPYPSYPIPPPLPAHPPQMVGYCPACRYPIYSGDVFCRRCGYRVS
ncbi:MAG: zinc ribbon domain-containing protein [Candidatus Caldarchaeales archaeon]